MAPRTLNGVIVPPPSPAEFQSSSLSTSLHMHLGGSVTLDCHFALAPSSSLSSLEWRRQHQGSGHSLFRYQVGSKSLAAQPKVHRDALLYSDNSKFIPCLSPPEPPSVHVIPSVVSFKRDVLTTLTCNIAGYHPLDVSVCWTQKIPEDDVEITLSNACFSSHQSQYGAYSITSYLSIISATAWAPATYSCHVSHVALSEPISVSIHLKSPEQTGSGGLVGGFIATVIFITVLFIVLRRRAAKPKSEQLLRASE
ncbi:LOW QUALITY PROTEIN: tapasin-related protein [Leptosomus discolor]